MSYFAEFLHQFGPEIRQNIRKTYNKENELINAVLTLIFNATCSNSINVKSKPTHQVCRTLTFAGCN